MINEKDIKVQYLTQNGDLVHSQITHVPTGISVVRRGSGSRVKILEELMEELEDKINKSRRDVREVVRDNLQIFLYLLMRDHLPSGAVAEIIVEIEKTDSSKGVEFTNKYLALHASELADRITKQK